MAADAIEPKRMENEDFSKDVAMFEELFKDRFTEKDAVYSKLKSKPLSSPTVVYPWKVKKQWFKSWDYGKERQNQERNRYNDRNSSNYRDRSEDGESSRDREYRRDDRNERKWNRNDNRGNNQSNYRRNYHREHN
ncbi:uncharacterized protein TNCT_71301 [Trichonephila clavata]|uniref:Uncharacterized protein n=1 Tax=Trichonephila clavata TaxID=2740835 RepID=A0A8X6L4U1_TRICU|nr:uncharacterized protein TNCT_71301 [Trichonephila clavata]